MELIRGLHNISARHQGCVATIGNFDGVHLGHQQVLQQVKAAAEQWRVPSLAITFEPQPREFFMPDNAPARLTPFRDKMQGLARTGLDAVLCLPFNEALRQLPALAFIDRILLQGLRVKHFVVGDDFRFGCDRAGDFNLLKRVGQARGFDVVNTQTFAVQSERVSSSRIRALLADADLATAEVLLGRPYRLSGRVVKGQQLGRQLGVPTANFSLKGKRPALQGVFAVKVYGMDDKPWPGVANIGMRPSVSGRQPVLEVHLFDYAGNLYGQHLEVEFCHFLRPEQRFADLVALQQQIHLDIHAARDWHRQQGWS